MKRWLGFAIRGVVVLIVVLGMVTATATLLAGQQVPDSVPVAVLDSVPQSDARVTPTRSASTELPGPRLRPDFARVEPAFASSNASSSTAAATNTITFTTLALVLVIILVVLLIAD